MHEKGRGWIYSYINVTECYESKTKERGIEFAHEFDCAVFVPLRNIDFM